MFEQKGDRMALAIRKEPIVKVLLNPILVARIPAGIVHIPMISEAIEVSQLTVVLSIPKSRMIKGNRGPGATHNRPPDNLVRRIIVPITKRYLLFASNSK